MQVRPNRKWQCWGFTSKCPRTGLGDLWGKSSNHSAWKVASSCLWLLCGFSTSNALQSSVFWVGLTVFVCVFFQPDRVMEFCKNNDLQLIVRAHECVMDGFERFAQGHLITLFSATNYCGTWLVGLGLLISHVLGAHMLFSALWEIHFERERGRKELNYASHFVSWFFQVQPTMQVQFWFLDGTW